MILEEARSVWLHQFNDLGEQTVATIAANLRQYAACDVLLVKVMDGQSYMSRWDSSPLAVSSPAAFQQRQTEAAIAGLTLIPWVVPNHQNDAALHAQFGPRLVIDLEPGESGVNYWLDSAASVVPYLRGLQDAGVAELYVSIDPRTWAEDALGLEAWVPLCSAILPQLYWPAFQTPWQDVIPMLDHLVTLFGPARPIIPVVDYRSTAADLAAFWAYATGRGCTAPSLWVMGQANAGALQNFGALALPGPLPARTFDLAAQMELIHYISGGSGKSDILAWLTSYQD